MDPQLEKVKSDALAKGWIIETAPFMGTTGYQLKSPSGVYEQFGGTEESVWRHAYKRGILPIKP